MTANRKVTGRATTMPVGLVIGILMAMAAMLVGTFMASLMIDREILGWNNSGYAVMIILIISSWVGATVAAGKIKRRRLLVCGASGGLFFLVLLSMTGLFFGGRYSGVGESGLLILCGSGLAFFLKYPGISERKRRKTRRCHG